MTIPNTPYPSEITAADGLSLIAERYALFVVDQWGVLHNGVTLHPGAVEALAGLKATGATVALLSNSGKRVSESHRRLEKLGIPRALYDYCLTSGEQVYRGLRDRGDPFYAALGHRFLMLAWDEDRGIVDTLDYEEVDAIADADFIICAGTDRGALEPYRSLLEAALARDLPLICANPDRVSVQPDGTLKICPGAVAARYEALGGRVKWHGKPHLEGYETIRKETGVTGLALGIGDSLEHDIAGAIAADMDGWFITNGIHREELGDAPHADAVAELGRKFSAMPRYFSRLFQW